MQNWERDDFGITGRWTFFRGNWEMGIFRLLPLTWEIFYPLTTAFLFAIVLWVSWTTKLLAFRAGYFGGPSLRWTSYIWGTRCPREKLRFLNSTLSVCCCIGMGLRVRVCFNPFLPTWYIFSLVWCVGVTQLVSRFLSEAIALCVAVDSVCLWEVSLGASYVTTLDQNLNM